MQQTNLRLEDMSHSLQSKKNIPCLDTKSYISWRLSNANYFPSLQFLSSFLPHQPISELHSSTNHRPSRTTNQRRLVSKSPSPINTTTFVLSSHSSVILDKC